jgi:hypothetical protein
MRTTPPTVLALLPCETIGVDGRGRTCILGVFYRFHAPNFPSKLERCALYLSVTDGHGPTPLTLRLVDGEDESVQLFAMDLLTTPFGSPLEVKAASLEVPAVTFPKPGVYAWQVACGGEVIYERRIVAEQLG